MRIRNSLICLGLAATLAGCGDGVENFVLTPSQQNEAVELFRTLDGSNNSPFAWGATDAQFLRSSPVAYGDLISTPSGATRPSARVVSNTCVAQAGDMPDAGGRSDFVWSWGQFIDHDITLTRAEAESFDVPIPLGDPDMDPMNTGTQVLSFTRSTAAPGTGTDTTNPRQHENGITAFLDASMVYGSDLARANALRTFTGGLLATSAGDFPPFNTANLEIENALGADPTTLFLCGDKRANEHMALTSLHTIFVREHNFWANQLAQANPDWTDEQLYQRARKIVGAEVQIITYFEFLPAILGQNALPAYSGYDQGVNPGIDTVFSTAGFRLGHTMVSTTFLRLQANGQPIPQGNLEIRDGFFQPQTLVNEGGVDPILRGLAADSMQSVDPFVVEDLRNFLFGPPGAGGLDLAALNIQRGRDHGIADYNTLRVAFGLTAVTQFSEITSDLTRQQNLAATYASVNDIDPWVGLLSEDHVAGSVTGPTLRAILIDQFVRLRDGDRFYYRNDTALASLWTQLEATRLSDIIRRNSGADLQANVFFRTP